MKIKQLIESCHDDFTRQYGHRLLPSQRKALDAMLACQNNCGEFEVSCDDCHKHSVIPLSCGHRSCPQCQQHLARNWLEKQQQKLLPVEYFMVTLTLPKELRTTVWQHQTILYELMIKAAVESVKTIGKNNHGIELAMTAVLHTHKRDKGFHPHVHLIVPGGGITRERGGVAFKKIRASYLVNETALARVFRGVFLRLFAEQSLLLPDTLPKQWISHIKSVGRGEKALAYLARYLYRGVISENDIENSSDGNVTYQYRESGTNTMKTMTLSAADFLWRLLRHVLPRGFRRVRDYGFLHGNAKRLLQCIQIQLQVKLPDKTREKITMICRHCSNSMTITRVLPKRIPMIFRFYLSSSRPTWYENPTI